MKIYTVTEFHEEFDQPTEVMWRFSFTSLEAAKKAINEETNEMYEMDLNYSKEHGGEDPDFPKPIEWGSSYAGGWEGYREYDETRFGIQETELK